MTHFILVAVACGLVGAGWGLAAAFALTQLGGIAS